VNVPGFPDIFKRKASVTATNPMRKLIILLLLAVFVGAEGTAAFKVYTACDEPVQGPGVSVQHCYTYEMVYTGTGYYPHVINEWWQPIPY
jgi:hypothetical protein